MARKGKMYEKTINSKHLDEEMVLKIYEPEEYSPMNQNQIVIMQDGEDYYQMGRVATVSDRMHEEYDLENTAFVGIHYIDRSDRLKKYHPSGEQFAAYKLFLMEEVMPIVQEICPINPLGTTVSLMGDSLAGTIALMTAIEYPEHFTNVILQSPLVDEAVLHAVEHELGDNKLHIYHSIGLKEINVQTTTGETVDFLTPNQQLSALLDKKVSNYEYKEIAEGNHTWKFWQQEMTDVFEMMLG